MKYLTALLLIGMAVAARFVPHPANFTPVLAVALFGGALLPGRVAYLLPLVAMLASDLLIGFAPLAVTLSVYGCFMAGAAIGKWLGKNRTWLKTALAAAGGSMLFYIVTNFAVWMSPPFAYSQTWEGLLQCYTMALPFFRNSLAGDLVWTMALFALFDLAQLLSRKGQQPPSAAAA